MPFINGRFYMNPTFGRAVEGARNAEAASRESEVQQHDPEAHWVTISGHHVLIQGGQGGQQQGAKQEEQDKQQKSPPQRSSKTFQGQASYYKLPGRNTASGDAFDADKMAAAMTSEKVRFGQTVTVTYTHEDEQGNIETRTISVVVNDRGPFDVGAKGNVKRPLRPSPKRVIDLTPAAFRELVGTTKPGVVPVTVTVSND